MIEQIDTSQVDVFTAPRLYLSSEAAGWEGLHVEAFHEPTELEGWIVPARSDISLILFAGETMRMAQRHLNSHWNVWDIHDGDLMLQPDMSTSYEIRWKSLSAAATQTLHMRLDRDLLSRTAEEVVDGDPAHLALIPRSGFRDPLLAQIGLTLWQELEQGSPAGRLYAQTAAQMIAVHLLRHYSSPALAIQAIPQGLTQRQVKRVTDYIVAHLNQELALETLAKQAGFSSYHFARLFRQTLGESPHQFVLRLRIEKAQRLLKDTEVPLAHVALESGFANQSHLTRIFKRRLGITPRAYRRDS